MYPKIATVNQAAVQLQQSPKSIRRLINNGELRAKKIGNKWFIPNQAIDDFINSEGHASTN